MCVFVCVYIYIHMCIYVHIYIRAQTIRDRSSAAVSWWIFCWRWSRLSFASFRTPAAEESRCFSAVT